MDNQNSDEYEKEEPIMIQLNSCSLGIIFSKLIQSKYFREKYSFKDIETNLKDDILKIETEKHINEISFTIFFKIFQGEILENITFDEYINFLKLSSLFQVSKVSSISKFIKQYMNTHLENIEFCIHELLSSYNDQETIDSFGEQYKAIIEDSLSNVINLCLKNTDFSQLEVPIIYKVIEKSKKDDSFHDLLYNFIDNSIEQNSVLFQFLDIKKLSKNNTDNLIKKYQIDKKHYQFLLYNNFDYFVSLKNENDELNNINDNLITQEKKHFEIFKIFNDVENISINGNNLLHYSCETENIELAKYVLSLKTIDINCQTQVDKKTALHIAIEKENIEIIKLLLECQDIDVNIKTGITIGNQIIQKTSLFLAIEKENIEITQLLLANQNININDGCTIDVKEEININGKTYITGQIYHKEKTPLYIAIKKNNAELAKLLLNNNNIDVNSGTYLYIFDLSKKNLHQRKRTKPLLYTAIQVQNIEIIQLLIENKNINLNIPFQDIRGFFIPKQSEFFKNKLYFSKYRNDLERGILKASTENEDIWIQVISLIF